MGKKPELAAIAARIKEAVGRRGPQKDVAALARISPRTFGRYLNAQSRVPATEIEKIAAVCSVPVEWLLRGEGSPNLEQQDNCGVDRSGHSSGFGALDEALFGSVFDAIHRLHIDERIKLPPADLGRLAFRKYSEIVGASGDASERNTMIKLIVAQLRAEIRGGRAATKASS